MPNWVNHATDHTHDKLVDYDTIVTPATVNGGGHPNLAAHTDLGLSAAHGHDFAATSHAHLDGDIPAGIARDAEVAATYATIHAHPYEASGAVATHAAAGDPHPTYMTAAEVGHPHANDHARQHSIISGSDHTFPGGATFLRADGTFAAPPGGSEAFPVGSVFISVVSTDPATLLGYGTWSAFGAGRVLVGRDGGDTDFDTAEETGGAKTVTLTEAQIPAHGHTQNAHNHTQDAHTHTQNAHAHAQQRFPTATGGSTGFTVDTSMSGTEAAANNTAAATATNQNATATNQAATAVNQNTGGGTSHPNLQPYIVVYMWKRTA